MGRTRDVSKILNSNTPLTSTYLTLSSASATYAPIAAGGLVQVVATSITKGASGSASIDSKGNVTFSGTESISLNGVFNSTYKNYRINMNIANATSAVWNYLKVRASGTDNTSNYHYSGSWRASSTTTFSTANGDPVGQWIVAYGGNNQTLITVDIASPFESVQTSFTSLSGCLDNTNESYSMWNGGSISNTNSYDGFTVNASSGNLTSGTITVYGYRN